MSSIFDDTMSTARSVVGSARENAENAVGAAKAGAEHAVGAAKAGAEHAAATTRSRFLDGLHTVTHLLAVVRSLGGDDVLGWIGLARRRSPIVTFAAFGAGMAVGAGAALVLAPMSGQALRAKILENLRAANGKAAEPTAEAVAPTQEPGKNGGAPGVGPLRGFTWM